jgi:sulfate adenylyltransferase subunit 1
MNNDLLKFATIGSVDDGKSTLIGRLLYESDSIYEDQYDAIKKASHHMDHNEVNLALLTDGLKAEREQGITIDVAYRYFRTDKRSFIISDCPGHVQYTKNMVTGISNVNLVLTLVDARFGIIEQTKRHAFLASLMQIKHLVLCINKMDLVDYDELIFENIKNDFIKYIPKLDIPDIRFIPISALNGDNITTKSSQMSWYKGQTLLDTLNDIYVKSDQNLVDPRYPIQCVSMIEGKDRKDYRVLMGKVEGGTFSKGEKVYLLPSGFQTSIRDIFFGKNQLEQVSNSMVASIVLNEDVDLSRGDMLVKANNKPTVSQDIEAMFYWFGSESLNLQKKYILKHTNKEVKSVFKKIYYKIDINTLHRNEDINMIDTNDIFRALIRTSSPIFYDKYRDNRATGSFILIDEYTNETVAAGMVK